MKKIICVKLDRKSLEPNYSNLYIYNGIKKIDFIPNKSNVFTIKKIHDFHKNKTKINKIENISYGLHSNQLKTYTPDLIIIPKMHINNISISNIYFSALNKVSRTNMPLKVIVPDKKIKNNLLLYLQECVRPNIEDKNLLSEFNHFDKIEKKLNEIVDIEIVEKGKESKDYKITNLGHGQFKVLDKIFSFKDIINSGDFKFPINAEILKKWHPELGVVFTGTKTANDTSDFNTNFIVRYKDQNRKNTSIWIDCGQGMKDLAKKIGENIENTNIFITHGHEDHDGGIWDLILDSNSKIINLYSHKTYLKSFWKKAKALDLYWKAKQKVKTIDITPIQGSHYKINDLNIEPFYSIHGIPTIALKIYKKGQKILYTSDGVFTNEQLDKLKSNGIISNKRYEDIKNFIQEKNINSYIEEQGGQKNTKIDSIKINHNINVNTIKPKNIKNHRFIHINRNNSVLLNEKDMNKIAHTLEAITIIPSESTIINYRNKDKTFGYKELSKIVKEAKKEQKIYDLLLKQLGYEMHIQASIYKQPPKKPLDKIVDLFFERPKQLSKIMQWTQNFMANTSNNYLTEKEIRHAIKKELLKQKISELKISNIQELNNLEIILNIFDEVRNKIGQIAKNEYEKFDTSFKDFPQYQKREIDLLKNKSAREYIEKIISNFNENSKKNISFKTFLKSYDLKNFQEFITKDFEHFSKISLQKKIKKEIKNNLKRIKKLEKSNIFINKWKNNLNYVYKQDWESMLQRPLLNGVCYGLSKMWMHKRGLIEKNKRVVFTRKSKLFYDKELTKPFSYTDKFSSYKLIEDNFNDNYVKILENKQIVYAPKSDIEIINSINIPFDALIKQMKHTGSVDIFNSSYRNEIRKETLIRELADEYSRLLALSPNSKEKNQKKQEIENLLLQLNLAMPKKQKRSSSRIIILNNKRKNGIANKNDMLNNFTKLLEDHALKIQKNQGFALMLLTDKFNLKSGHAIGLRYIANHKTKKYQITIFDPNIGEFEFLDANPVHLMQNFTTWFKEWYDIYYKSEKYSNLEIDFST